MATYYVKWDATGAGNGTSWANAYTTIAAAIAARNSAGTIIEISGGSDGHVYNEIFNAQYGTAFTIKGSTEAGHNGRVSISGAGKADTIAKIDAQTLQNLHLYGADSTKPCVAATGSNPGALIDCFLGDASVDRVSVPDRRLMTKSGTGTLTLTRCVLAYCGNVQGAVVTAGSVVLNNCTYKFNEHGFTSDGNLTFNNCAIFGNCFFTTTSVVRMMSAGNAVFNNCNIFANGPHPASIDIIRTTGTGTITYNNCNLLPGLPTHSAFYGYAGTKNNCITRPTLCVSPRREGFSCVIVDDYESLQYFYDIIDQLDTIGAKCAIALSRPHLVSAETWATLRGHIANGHDVLNHTMSHFNFSIATAITITGPANSTITFTTSVSDADPTQWGGVLSLKVSGSEVFSVNVAASGSYSTPSAVAAAVTAFGNGWSASVTSAGTSGSLFACCTALTDMPVSSAYEMAFNMQKVVYYEVGCAKKIIELNLGQECKCLAYPYGGFTSTVKWLINNSANYPSGTTRHIFARAAGYPNLTSISLASDMYSGTVSKPGWQVFEAYSRQFADVAGNNPSDDTITERVGGWGESLRAMGGVGMTYLHNEATDGERYYAPATIKKCVQALELAGVVITTPTALMDRVTTSGLYTDADADGTRWVRTYSDDGDYRLLPTSPCIGAGVDVGLTADADGNAVPGAVGYDIGPYSYMPGWKVFDGTMPALALASTAPGSLLEVQEWTSASVSKRQIDRVSR